MPDTEIRIDPVPFLTWSQIDNSLTPIVLNTDNKKVKTGKVKSYEQRLSDSVPKNWRFIKPNEILKYPYKKLKDNYNPEYGWQNVNASGVDRLGLPYQTRWGVMIIPDK